MAKHSNRPGHQSGHNRVTVDALIMRDDHPTIPMTITLDTPPTTWIDPEAWRIQRFGTARLVTA